MELARLESEIRAAASRMARKDIEKWMESTEGTVKVILWDYIQSL